MCSAKKLQIPISYSLALSNWGAISLSTAFKTTILNVISLTRFAILHGNLQQHLYRSMTNFTMGYVMVFNVTFNYISVISWCQFYLWWKPEYSEETIDLPQVTDKLYHILFYRVQFEFELTTLVVIITDCTSSCCTIMTTTSPPAL